MGLNRRVNTKYTFLIATLFFLTASLDGATPIIVFTRRCITIDAYPSYEGSLTPSHECRFMYRCSIKGRTHPRLFLFQRKNRRLNREESIFRKYQMLILIYLLVLHIQRVSAIFDSYTVQNTRKFCAPDLASYYKCNPLYIVAFLDFYIT